MRSTNRPFFVMRLSQDPTTLQQAGGHNQEGNYTDNFIINFPKADTYTVEIDYSQHINAQQLTFYIALSGQTLKFPYPGTAGSTEGLSAAVGRNYWTTMADQTTGVATESSSSPASTTTGPVTLASVNCIRPAAITPARPAVRP